MKEAGKNGLAVLGGLLAAGIIVAAVVAASYYGGIWGNHVQARYQKRVVTSQVEQGVRTAQFAQAAYESFFNQCAAVVADNAKIDLAQKRVAAAKALPDDAFGQKATSVSNAETDLTGLQQSQAGIAAQYNADAQEYTRGQFLDANLPPRLDSPYKYACG